MEININNNLFKVTPVITDKDIQNGMMGKKFNNDFNGMLFVLDPGEHSFWMKDCITSLDIIFIKDLKINKKIYIHINTTNPILLPSSDERKIVEENGWQVSYDGMEITL